MIILLEQKRTEKLSLSIEMPSHHILSLFTEDGLSFPVRAWNAGLAILLGQTPDRMCLKFKPNWWIQYPT